MIRFWSGCQSVFGFFCWGGWVGFCMFRNIIIFAPGNTQKSSKQICLSNHFLKAESHFAPQFGIECWDIFIFGVDSANAILLRRRSILLGIDHLKFVFFAKFRRDTIQVTWLYLIWTIWQKFSQHFLIQLRHRWEWPSHVLLRLRENMQCRYSPIGSSMDCNAYVRRSPPQNTLLLRVHLRSIFVTRSLSAVAAFVLRFADRYHWLATIATRRFVASGLVMLAMHKVTRFHWNIGKFWMFMILRMMLDVDDSFVGMFFNWNVSCLCIYACMLSSYHDLKSRWWPLTRVVG